MRKILLFAVALVASASLMAKDVTCTNLYRYVYTDYATGSPYYSLQFGDANWNSYYFGFSSANGPMVGQTYTMADMLASQTYVSVNYQSDPIATLTFNRFYDGLQEKFAINATTESGEQYNINWAADKIPAELSDVNLDTIIVCDFMNYGSYKAFTPLVPDYDSYNFTIALTGDLPTVGQQKTYTWKANSVYIGNASFSLPNDWNTKAFDAKYTIEGIDGGYKGTAEYSMTNGKKYTFDFTYTIPHVEQTVNLSGYDLKIQTNWDKTVSFSWQNDTYSAQLPINSTDTLGNWKGNDIIISNCSFQLSATYQNLGVYAIDSIYVTRTEDGYIRLQSSILCKNNTLYVLDISNQESPYYVKYDIDGTGVKWNYFPAAQYGTGRAMGLRFNNDSIWFNTQPTDEGADGYSIKETYGTYGDPLWVKDSITISYDPNTGWGSPLSVYMAEKYYDAELNVNLSSRSYENVEGDGVWNYEFSCGSYMESNRYSFKFGIICPIEAPAPNRTYTLGDMTEDYRTKGYDPDYNEIKYDVVTLYRELVWPANDAEKFTINVHTTDGKAYKLIYAADTIPTATDTIEFAPIKADIRQLEYYFQFEGEGVADDSQYRFQLAFAGEEVTPTTYYWKQNDIYKPGTIIYNNSKGEYVNIADGWAQINAISEEEEIVGYGCNAYILGYDGICYHAYLKYTMPVAEDTVAIELKNMVITNSGEGNINFTTTSFQYNFNLNIAANDPVGVFRDEVKNGSIGLAVKPFTTAQLYSVDSIEVTENNGIYTLKGGMLCTNNVYYSLNITSEEYAYFLGTKDGENDIVWSDFVKNASGQYEGIAVYYEGGFYVNTAAATDGGEKFCAIEDIYCINTVEKYDTVQCLFDRWYGYIMTAEVIGKYQPQSGLHDAQYRQAPAIKRLENGRIIIERYGRKYDLMGR